MVRCLKAMVLLVALAVSFIPPITSATSEQSLPECCRRAGKHHCAMLAHTHRSGANSKEIRFETNSRCRFFGTGSGPATGVPRAELPAMAEAFQATLAAGSTVVAQAEAQGRVAFSRSQQKRGPPQLLS